MGSIIISSNSSAWWVGNRSFRCAAVAADDDAAHVTYIAYIMYPISYIIYHILCTIYWENIGKKYQRPPQTSPAGALARPIGPMVLARPKRAQGPGPAQKGPWSWPGPKGPMVQALGP